MYQRNALVTFCWGVATEEMQKRPRMTVAKRRSVSMTHRNYSRNPVIDVRRIL
jgi:hypothetical protein